MPYPSEFEWSQEWVDEPDDALTMAHSSIVVTADDRVVTGATNAVGLLFRDRDGGNARLAPVPEADDLHGITLVEQEGLELLWIADTAIRLFGGKPELDIRRIKDQGQVILVDLDGRLRSRLAQPAHGAYEDDATQFRPTAVAVDEERHGGSGDIYVADGYGASLIHRYAADGTYLDSLSGEEGAGRFNEPHDVLVDRRRTVPELYVADRVNHRIQVYGLDGRFKRVVGEGLLPGPTQLALSGDALVVTDLLAGRVSLFDRDDALIGHLFEHPSAPPAWDDLPDAWPNARGAGGLIAPVALRSEQFHTPHGVATHEDGTIYVSEFAIGGRIAVLRPAG
jgi:hypothetical protein